MTLSVIFDPYHFVHTILSMPFFPIPFYPYTILSIPFCPYHFVRYHFVLEPLMSLTCMQLIGTVTRNLAATDAERQWNQDDRSQTPVVISLEMTMQTCISLPRERAFS